MSFARVSNSAPIFSETNSARTGPTSQVRATFQTVSDPIICLGDRCTRTYLPKGPPDHANIRFSTNIENGDDQKTKEVKSSLFNRAQLQNITSRSSLLNTASNPENGKRISEEMNQVNGTTVTDLSCSEHLSEKGLQPQSHDSAVTVDSQNWKSSQGTKHDCVVYEEMLKVVNLSERQLKQEIKELKRERTSLLDKLRLFILSNAQLQDELDARRKQIADQEHQLREARASISQLESQNRFMEMEIKGSTNAENLLRTQLEKLKLGPISRNSVSDRGQVEIDLKSESSQPDARCATLEECTQSLKEELRQAVSLALNQQQELHGLYRIVDKQNKMMREINKPQNQTNMKELKVHDAQNYNDSRDLMETYKPPAYQKIQKRINLTPNTSNQTCSTNVKQKADDVMSFPKPNHVSGKERFQDVTSAQMKTRASDDKFLDSRKRQAELQVGASAKPSRKVAVSPPLTNVAVLPTVTNMAVSPPVRNVLEKFVDGVREVPSLIKAKMIRNVNAGSTEEFEPMVVRICPYCNVPFDDNDVFVGHLRECNVPHGDRQCPVCDERFEPAILQEDFEEHVNKHFANETIADNFVDLSHTRHSEI